MPHVN